MATTAIGQETARVIRAMDEEFIRNVVVYRRQAGGWKAVADIFNSNLPRG